MRTRVPTTLVAAAALLTLAACGSSTDTAAPAAAAKPVVVASTDVYGSIATAVGGDLVEVRSIIDSPSADPHEYEATPADAAAVAQAVIVVKNGGGYDSFADRLVESAGTNPTVIDAVELSGLEPAEDAHADETPEEHAAHGDEGHDHGEFNEHVWYDLGTVRKVADRLATDLGQQDTANAATYTANAQAFGTDLDALQQKVDAIKATHSGQSIAVTEPVPLYLTDAAGLANVTPEAFSEAVEEGNDPAAAVLAETLQVVPTAKVVVANSQTESASTAEVEKAATAANVPVVRFSETLPDGVDSYAAWQTAQLDDLTGALNRTA
jgi:zinc/manganese transport system substrate-binding protein